MVSYKDTNIFTLAKYTIAPVVFCSGGFDCRTHALEGWLGDNY